MELSVTVKHTLFVAMHEIAGYSLLLNMQTAFYALNDSLTICCFEALHIYTQRNI